MIKVVDPHDLVQIEKKACQEGCLEEHFMEEAGKNIAASIMQWQQANTHSKHICVLAGKGGNGGDGYVAARYLLQEGFCVHVIAAYSQEEWGSLCRLQAQRFMEGGGKIIPFATTMAPPGEGCLIDALVGTGFRGGAEGVLAQAIVWANNLALPILAIDIPSGLCGTTGKIGSVAIQAHTTIYLEFPKIGFFLEKGWDHVGALQRASFGLAPTYQDAVPKKAYLIDEISMQLPSLQRTRNKYMAGYVIVLGGNDTMKGAGALASYAALRSDAGLVRWFYLGEEGCRAACPLEILSCCLEGEEKLFWQEVQRAKALVVGPGLGRGKQSAAYMRNILSKTSLPLVIDADALYFLALHPKQKIRSSAVLTPHRGELQRLLEVHQLKMDFMEACQVLCEKMEIQLLVKGAPNFLFSPGDTPCILPFGNPGMATAGSGDVLSGIIAALLSKQMSLKEAALLGCYLHGLAGDFAAKTKTPYCIIATDIIEALPMAFAQLMSQRDPVKEY